jgi:RHS repeat-associated protein
MSTRSWNVTYDALLRRTAATSRYGITNGWTYDDQGRMLTEATTYSGQTYTVGYRYDSRGRLDEITYPSGRKAGYTFDQRSAIDLIKWENNTIEDRGYDDLARLNAVTRTGSAVDETRSYDAAGRLTGITNTNVGNATYTYDANHNKLSESWSGAMAAWNFVTTNGGTYTDGYDHEDRFVHFAQSSQAKTFNFTRSDIGNITNVNLNGTGTARGYNNIHALTSVGAAAQTFNSDGNLATNQFGHTNTWDEAGFMKQSVVPSGSTSGVAGTNEYGYDATQRRIFKKITRSGSVAEHTVYVHAGPNLIAEYAAGATAASPGNEYVYAQEIDSLVLLVRSTGGGSGNEKLTITRNQQWSVTALSDSSTGNVVERYTYDHFGKRTILEPNGTTVRSTSSYNMPFGYTSRQHDPETGLMYFRARYYDSSTGEFTSPDPLEYVNGMSLYRGYFVIVGVDPNGLMKVSVDRNATLFDPKTGKISPGFGLTPCGGSTAIIKYTPENLPQNLGHFVFIQKICVYVDAEVIPCEVDSNNCCNKKPSQRCEPCCWIEFGFMAWRNGVAQDKNIFQKVSDPGCSSQGSYKTTAEMRAIQIWGLDVDDWKKIKELMDGQKQTNKCNTGCLIGTKEFSMGQTIETSIDGSKDPAWWTKKSGVFDSIKVETVTRWSCCNRLDTNWQTTKFPDGHTEYWNGSNPGVSGTLENVPNGR